MPSSSLVEVDVEVEVEVGVEYGVEVGLRLRVIVEKRSQKHFFGSWVGGRINWD